MSKPKNKSKRQKTGIPGLSITAKDDRKPPPDWIMNIPPQNVSTKIELHEKAIGEKPKDGEKLEVKTQKKRESTTLEVTQNDANSEPDNPELNAAKSKERDEQANKILEKVMTASVLPKKIKKRKSKNAGIERLILGMSKMINHNMSKQTEELKSAMRELDHKQELKNKKNH